MIRPVTGGWDMASGYEKMECGVTDPNLGWGGAPPSPVADALIWAFVFAGGALQLWGMAQGVRYLFGF